MVNNITLDSVINNPNFNFNNLFYNNLAGEDGEEDVFLLNEFTSEYTTEEQFINESTSKKISILTLNVQSLQSKFENLRLFISKLKNFTPEIICLQETWSIPDDVSFDLPGYHPLQLKSRSNFTQGGGVGIYVKQNLRYNLRTDLISVDRLLEAIFVDVVFENKTFTIGSLYHPPSSPSRTQNEHFDQFLEILGNLCDLLSDQKNVILTGDFNLDCLLYQTNTQVTDYIDLLFSYGFLQTVTKPTRLTSHSAKIIDHVITNCSELLTNTYIFVENISDHFPILQQLTLKTMRNNHPQPVMERKFSKTAQLNFKVALNANDWTPVLTSDNAQTSYNIFEKHFNSLFDLFFPVVKKGLIGLNTLFSHGLPWDCWFLVTL